MTPEDLRKLDQQLTAFVESMVVGMGRAERRQAMTHYVQGLLLDGERKSMEPMAARLVGDESQVQAMRQRLQECVSVSTWDERWLFERLARKLEAELPGIAALIIDDTGFPKKGHASVGVARQYSGTLGRTDNCQVGVSLHLGGFEGSGCIGFRLYLPETWANDLERRRKAHVPDDVTFAEKGRLALELLDNALAWGVRKHVVLADAGYGDSISFRDALTQRGLGYVVGIRGSILLWPPGLDYPPHNRIPGRVGRPRAVAGEEPPEPLTAKELAASLPPKAWKTVSWRDGSRGKQSSRFITLRVRTAHGHKRGYAPGDEQWFIAEWPRGEKEPTKFYLSNLPAKTSRVRLVRFVKMRWRVERDYQEMKSELGLDHFEGRTWPGFHHHVALCALAHAFLSLQRALFPLSTPRWTLSVIRRHLQQVLLKKLGCCPLCRRTITPRSPPAGASLI